MLSRTLYLSLYLSLSLSLVLIFSLSLCHTPGDDNATTHGPIEVDKVSVREEPYSLPQGFSWAPLDLGDPAVVSDTSPLPSLLRP